MSSCWGAGACWNTAKKLHDYHGKASEAADNVKTGKENLDKSKKDVKQLVKSQTLDVKTKRRSDAREARGSSIEKSNHVLSVWPT